MERPEPAPAGEQEEATRVSDARPAKRLILIHGHGHKPPAGELENLWRSAISRGLERDHGRKLARLQNVQVSFVYYGDLTRGLRARERSAADEHLDLADRYTALKELGERDSTKRFRSHYYHRMRGRSAAGKWLMHLCAPLARGLRLDDALIDRVSPELARYRRDAAFAEAVRARLLESLVPALEAREDILLLAHCMGSVVAYDCLWTLSRGPSPVDHRVRTLVTLGSPLASDAVRAGLLGADEPVERRYPENLANWFNIAAEDDYVCHDPTVANDFAPMIGRQKISRLEDIGIFNFARRYGRSNPHHALGYLIHPHTATLLAEWLSR